MITQRLCCRQAMEQQQRQAMVASHNARMHAALRAQEEAKQRAAEAARALDRRRQQALQLMVRTLPCSPAVWSVKNAHHRTHSGTHTLW